MIEHKNSGEIIDSFPKYGKHYMSMYGYIVLTADKKVLFFYQVEDSMTYEDLTVFYNVEI
jgi:hypothetical protein